ncbi:MAG TPA: serine hydrolase [Christensenellaceae bacterium]|nr:serine hydrolase [Christensenellaceae bacterium]
MYQNSLSDKVKDIMLSYREKAYFRDAVVSVFNKDEVFFTLSFGNTNENTLFDVASLTKIATSTLILLSINEGHISLDDKILDLIPDLLAFPDIVYRLEHTKLENLLTHTSGLPAWYPFYTSNEDFYHVLNKSLSLPVEKSMVYSDLNFMLLGLLLEKIYNAPLDNILSSRLVALYKLGNMCYLPKDNNNIAPSSYGNLIEEEMCREIGLSFNNWRKHEPLIGEVNDGNAHYYFKGVSGHAGIFSDISAYVKLAQLYLNSDDELLNSSMLEHTPSRGLGWQLGERYPKGCGHTGFTGTSIYLSKKLNIGCVIFTNRLFFKTRNTKPIDDVRLSVHKVIVDNM